MIDPVRLKGKSPVVLPSGPVMPELPDPSYGRMDTSKIERPAYDSAHDKLLRLFGGIGAIMGVAGGPGSELAMGGQALGLGASSALQAGMSEYSAEQEAFQERMQKALDYNAEIASTEARDKYKTGVEAAWKRLDLERNAPLDRAKLRKAEADASVSEWTAANPATRKWAPRRDGTATDKRGEMEILAVEELDGVIAKLAPELEQAQAAYEAADPGDFMARGQARERVNAIQERLDKLEAERRATLKTTPKADYDAYVARQQEAESKRRVTAAMQQLDHDLAVGAPLGINLMPELRDGVVARSVERMMQNGQLTAQEALQLLQAYEN